MEMLNDFEQLASNVHYASSHFDQAEFTNKLSEYSVKSEAHASHVFDQSYMAHDNHIANCSTMAHDNHIFKI